MTNADDPINAICGTEENPIVNLEFEGLTKREYFAAMAMGINRTASDVEFVVRCSKNLNPLNEPHKPAVLSERQAKATLAVMDADALIEALNK